MELKNFFAQDRDTGAALPAAEATLYVAGTLTLATGLQDRFNQPLSNPFVADANGVIELKAPNGTYDLKVVSGVREYTRRITFLDAVDYLNGITLSSLGDVATLTPAASHSLVYDATDSQWKSRLLTPMIKTAFPSPLPTGVAVTNPIPENYYTVGRYMHSTGVPTFGVPSTTAAIAHTVAANEVYARPFIINRPTTFNKAGSYIVATAAASSASVKIYAAAASGLPGLEACAKMTISTAASGWIEATLPAPVTLQPGLYYCLTTTTSTTATARACIDGLATIVGFGGTQVTGLFQGSSQTRLDLPNLSAQTWNTDGTPSNISSTRDTFWFNFTSE